jgi:hypothetical protein
MKRERGSTECILFIILYVRYPCLCSDGALAMSRPSM